MTGLYVAHWEFTRFAITSRTRWQPWPHRVLCQLEAAPGLPASPLEVAGVSRPAEWRSSPGLRFRVTAE